MKKSPKTSTFMMQNCIQSLVACSPRQLDGEDAARQVICSILEEYQIPYALQHFQTAIPVADNTHLFCDGTVVPAEACCFVSGEIMGKDAILSSAMPSRYCFDIANINFNPSCPVITPGNHYFAPAVAVSHNGLLQVLAAADVRGNVSVQKVNHASANIVVGNKSSPLVICFAHYDSIKTGAIDNASGVAVLLATLLKEPLLLRDGLFVFAGNEELSYDKPTYWGHGFRVFESINSTLLEKAKRIIAIDCVGNGPPQLLGDPGIVSRAFPLVDAATYAKKTVLLTGDFVQLMTVYHSDLDDGRGIEDTYLEQTRDLLIQEIQAHI